MMKKSLEKSRDFWLGIVGNLVSMDEEIDCWWLLLLHTNRLLNR